MKIKVTTDVSLNVVSWDLVPDTVTLTAGEISAGTYFLVALVGCPSNFFEHFDEFKIVTGALTPKAGATYIRRVLQAWDASSPLAAVRMAKNTMFDAL